MELQRWMQRMQGKWITAPRGDSDYHFQITLIVRVLEMPLSGEGARNAEIKGILSGVV